MPDPEDLIDHPRRTDSELTRPGLATLLCAAAAAFFVIYTTTVLIDVLPPETGSPRWQQLFVASLLNNAGFPLIGLVLIHLAHTLLPEEPLLAHWTRRVERLAVVASLLMLLLIPLHGWATLQGLQNQLSSQAGELRTAEQRYATLRQVIQSAGSREELQRQLERQDGPRLNASDLSRPLPILRQDLLDGLDQARRLTVQQLSGLSPAQIWTAAVQGLRTTTIAAALAIAFAAGARRQDRDESLLLEWIQGLSQRRHRRAARRTAQAVEWMEEQEEREELLRVTQLRRSQEGARRRQIRQHQLEEEELDRLALQELERREQLRREQIQPGSPPPEPPGRRSAPREARMLWTPDQEVDEYYEEIAPREGDPPGSSPRP